MISLKTSRLFHATALALTLGACADTLEDKTNSAAPTFDGKADGGTWLTEAGTLGFGADGAISGAFERDDVFFVHTIEVFGAATIDLEITHKGTASRLDTYLSVHGPLPAGATWTADVLAADDDSGYGRHSKLKGLALPAAGRYAVVVTTIDGVGRGKYRLEANCAGDGCTAPADASTCHPAIADAIRACHADAIDEGALDEGLVTTDELMRSCADVEVVAGAWDDLCGDAGARPTICGADLDDFNTNHLTSCRAELVATLLDGTCLFGNRYRDMFDRPGALVVQWRRTLTIDDADTLEALEATQVLEAVRQTAYDDVTTLAEAFEAVDEGRVNQTALWDASGRRAFIAYEVGAGDNSFGAWFPADSATAVALNNDGDVYECAAFWGDERRLCDATEPCAADLACHGRAGGVGPGRCLDTRATTPGDGANCTVDTDCGAGLVCAGASAGGGLCNPAWMRGAFTSEPGVALADGPSGTTTSALHVFGLATVSTDVYLDLFVTHPRISDLRITLTNPDGTEGVVFEGDRNGTELYLKHQAVMGFPGDESVNGTWTLHVTDTVSGQTGTLRELGLELTSRWD